MSELRSTSLPEPNPVTREAHRREVLWQITIPMMVGVIIFLALIYFVTRGGVSEVSRWGDIALIWLILPVLLLSLIVLAVVGAMGYGVIKLIQIIPPYARKLQDLINLIGEKVKRTSDFAVEPVLRVNSFSAGLKTLVSRLRR